MGTPAKYPRKLASWTFPGFVYYCAGDDASLYKEGRGKYVFRGSQIEPIHVNARTAVEARSIITATLKELSRKGQ